MSKDSNNTIIIGKIAYFPDMKAFLHQGYKVYTIVDSPIYRSESSIGQKFFEDMQKNDCVSWGTEANGDHFVEYIYQAPSEYEDMVIKTCDALDYLRNCIKVDIEIQMDELQQDYAAVENAQLIGG